VPSPATVCELDGKRIPLLRSNWSKVRRFAAGLGDGVGSGAGEEAVCENAEAFSATKIVSVKSKYRVMD
jgi:hypothetical protein